MKTCPKFLLSITVFAFGMLFTAANAAAADAKILKVIGSGPVKMIGADGQVTIVQEGAAIPENAKLETGAGVEVYLQVVDGVIATVKENSTVSPLELSGEQPKLDLIKGNVVSQIDKAKMAGKLYGVKTPRGVAAARGTTYTVTVDGTSYSVVTLNGAVTISPLDPTAGPSITVGAGGVSVDGGATQTGAQVAANPALNAQVTRAAAIAVAAVAVVADDSGRFGSAATHATSELSATIATVVTTLPQAVAQVTASAAAAAPNQAASIVTTAITTAATSGQNVAAVAATVAQAAAQGAASQATNATTAAAAVQSIASAAARAAASSVSSTQAAAIAQSVATAAARGGNTGASSAGINASTQISTAASTGSSQGASEGSGQTVTPPSVEIPTDTTVEETPVTEVDPTLVSPSGGNR